MCTEGEETVVPERPQVIIFATFQGVPKSPPRITRLNELVCECITCNAAAAGFVLEVIRDHDSIDKQYL